MINKPQCEIGIIGLGVMGRNLLLNMADKGFTVAGFDKDPSKVKSLQDESKNHTIHDTTDIEEFIKMLKPPRSVMLLVPAGPIVDSVIEELVPLLSSGDLIIDAGNSYFKDTNIRTNKLKEKSIQFLGIGVSGGEYGARHGPSIMPGGSKAAYDQIHLVLEAIAAKVKSEPCVTYLGSGSSGHFVKMVHNGIEYAIMQLISESYDLMKRGLGLNDEKLHDVYSQWNKGELNSYLIEITSHIFEKIDDKTGKKLVDNILDVAKQNGTGMWTTQSAMELQMPAPTIDAAVTMRDLSVFINERKQISKIYQLSATQLIDDNEKFITTLHDALFTAVIISYAQGMAILKAASDKYQYGLSLDSVAKIWRGGCIIRAALLEDISTAFSENKDLLNLMLDPHVATKIMKHEGSLRKIVSQTPALGIPIPGLMSALGYLDAFRSNVLPANLIQAQRDYFGSHSYDRIDTKGTFHTQWGEK
jgi:6-phosphogluconate dehydrogenase